MMRACLLLSVAFGAAGCAGIPPLNTATISAVPASGAQMAKARRAVEICSLYPDGDAVVNKLRDAGYSYRSEFTAITLRNGDTINLERTIGDDDGNLILQVSKSRCLIGLRNMTPQQSFELASIWARKYNLITNAEAGDGLSTHVVQAWRAPYIGAPRIYAAAHKTWPWDRGEWPTDTPGAAVTLSHQKPSSKEQ